MEADIKGSFLRVSSKDGALKFSLLIANYNNGKYFKDCYDSLVTQIYTNWNAVIVDDCSTDNSIKLIEEIIKNDDRFTLYKNEINRGCGYSKHKCVQLATGELCGFIDPDDALLPNAVAAIVSAFEKNPEAVLVHSTLIFCDKALKRESIHNRAISVDTKDINFFNFFGAVTHFAGFKKYAYQKTEGIDPYMQRAVDQDLYLKLAETGSFVFVNKPLYLYRIHKESISKNANAKKAHFWHWIAVINAARRRNINIEEKFSNAFTSKKDIDKLNKIVSGKADGRLYVGLLLKKIKQMFKLSLAK